MLVFSTYMSIFIWETHVRVPDLKAVLQAGKLHLLDCYPEVGLKTLHHLQNSLSSKCPDGRSCSSIPKK